MAAGRDFSRFQVGLKKLLKVLFDPIIKFLTDHELLCLVAERLQLRLETELYPKQSVASIDDVLLQHVLDMNHFLHLALVFHEL